MMTAMVSPQRVEDFGAIAVLAGAGAIMFHQLDNVAALELLLRQVARQPGKRPASGCGQTTSSPVIRLVGKI